MKYWQSPSSVVREKVVSFLQRQGSESYMCSSETMQHIFTASESRRVSPEVSAESKNLLRKTLIANPTERLGVADMLDHACMSLHQIGALP